ncbi:LUD domain-containing protein [Caldiplasma sukawensis]
MKWNEIIEGISNSHQERFEKIAEKYPYILKKAENLRDKKMEVINNLEKYTEMAMKSVEKTGGHAYFAKNADDARKIIGNITGRGKKIVFSKTNAAYEIRLREYLSEHGNEVWETDLGEFLVQISNGWPSHIVEPAIDMSKVDAIRNLKKITTGLNENSDVKDVVAVVRNFLMKKYFEADIGITGANSVSADTGSIFLVENEGNIRMDTVVPQIHIVIVGVDKIVPEFSDGFDEVTIQAAYAGLFPPTYINVTSGPSSTADIESKRVSPATGPKELNVIFLDNGRIEASKNDEIKEALLCIKCGRCYFSCPVYRTIGKEWMGEKSPYNGPMGVMWNYITNGDGLPSFYCVHSGGCKEVCPMGINIPEVIKKIKENGGRKL